MKTSSCKGCTASIIWATTVNGKVMPLDAKPDPTGHFTLSPDKSAKLWALPAAPSDAPDRLRYTSHFATCPAAGRFRKESA